VRRSDERVQEQFHVHLPGLLTVLAEHLYSNRAVAVRELLQNAHDSCRRRAVECPNPAYRPRVDVAVDRERGVLVIADNGSGLSAAEVRDYLATIGRSYTRELKGQVGVLAPGQAAGLIGHFGFGFLSAFLMASAVTATTRSYRAGSEPVRWSCDDGER
jgi:molecular chaperone HtpG